METPADEFLLCSLIVPDFTVISLNGKCRDAFNNFSREVLPKTIQILLKSSNIISV